MESLSDLSGLEQTAAAQSRGILINPVGWSEIVTKAQIELGNGLRGDDPQYRLLKGEGALRMVAAARMFDASSTAEQDAERQPSLLLLTAASFALNGNFPSASAIARTLFEVGHVPSQSEWVALTVFSPRLIVQSIDGVSSGSTEREFLELLNLYFQSGDPSLEPTLRQSLNLVLKNSPDPFSTVLLGYAHTVLEILFDHSIAKVLRSEQVSMPSGYLEALLDSLVRVLLPPQVEAITQSGLLRGTDNVLISFPTSTGKTLLGELTMYSSLGDEDGVAVYIAPYVALASQIHETFDKRIPPDVTLHSAIGGYGLTQSLNFESGKHIVIATPERFDATMRANPRLGERLRCVIVDEAHIVSNAVRGIRVEGIITRLRMLQTRGMVFRIVCLSAVIGDTDAMMRWLGAERSKFISTTWRSTARRVHYWSSDGELLWMVGDDVLRRDGQTPSSIIAREALAWPEPNIFPSNQFAQTRSQSARVHRNVAYLAQRLVNEATGPVLCLCGTKPGTRALAYEIASRLPEPSSVAPEIEELAFLLREKYPYLGALAYHLQKGVAYHNASLPMEVRRRIERGIMAGHIHAVASTTTLAEGIDLPFYSTILVDWLVWDGVATKPIDALLYRNIAGRCGRAGFHTEGEFYVFDNLNGDPRFTGPQIRRNLQREIFFSAEPPTLKSVAESSDFLSRIEYAAATDAQFVAAIPENPDADELVTDFVKHSYAFSRLPGDLTLTNALDRSSERVLDEDAGAIARAASPLKLTSLGVATNASGLSPNTARTLVEVLNQMPVESMPDGSLAYLLLSGLASTPELANDRLRKRLGGTGRYPVTPSDVAPVVDHWLEGWEVQDLFVDLPYVRRSTRRDSLEAWSQGTAPASSWYDEFDKFAEFIDGAVCTFLPWIARASFQFQPFVEVSPDFDWLFYAECLEVGANTRWAVAAIREEAPASRRYLAKVGGRFTEELSNPGDPLGLVTIEAQGRQYIDDLLQDSVGSDDQGDRDELDRRHLLEWLCTRSGIPD